MSNYRNSSKYLTLSTNHDIALFLQDSNQVADADLERKVKEAVRHAYNNLKNYVDDEKQIKAAIGENCFKSTRSKRNQPTQETIDPLFCKLGCLVFGKGKFEKELLSRVHEANMECTENAHNDEEQEHNDDEKEVAQTLIQTSQQASQPSQSNRRSPNHDQAAKSSTPVSPPQTKKASGKRTRVPPVAAEEQQQEEKEENVSPADLEFSDSDFELSAPKRPAKPTPPKSAKRQRTASATKVSPAGSSPTKPKEPPTAPSSSSSLSLSAIATRRNTAIFKPESQHQQQHRNISPLHFGSRAEGDYHPHSIQPPSTAAVAAYLEGGTYSAVVHNVGNTLITLSQQHGWNPRDLAVDVLTHVTDFQRVHTE